MTQTGVDTYTFGPARLWIESRFAGELSSARVEMTRSQIELLLGNGDGVGTPRRVYPSRRRLTVSAVIGRIEPEMSRYFLSASNKRVKQSGDTKTFKELAVLRADRPYQLARDAASAPTLEDPAGSVTWTEGADYQWDPDANEITPIDGSPIEGTLVRISYDYTAGNRVQMGLSESSKQPVETRLVHRHPDGRSRLELTLWQSVVSPAGPIRFEREEFTGAPVLIRSLWTPGESGEEFGRLQFSGPAFAELAHFYSQT